MYRHPVSSKELPYPRVTVSAWVHGEKKGLAETKTDSAGKFCMELPAGVDKVDLKVWGLERFEQQNYICEGSAEGVVLGSGQGRCEGGNCTRVDIKAQCRERVQGGR